MEEEPEFCEMKCRSEEGVKSDIFLQQKTIKYHGRNLLKFIKIISRLFRILTKQSKEKNWDFKNLMAIAFFNEFLNESDVYAHEIFF